MPTGDRLTTGLRAVNERRVAAHGVRLFVCFAQTAPPSCRTTQNPFPSVAREQACGQPFLATNLAASHGDGHVPRPSSLSSEAQESHKIPRFPRTWFRFPSFSPHPIPDNWFHPVKHPGSPEDASHSSYRGTCHLLAKDGIPGRCALRNGGILQMQTRTRYPDALSLCYTTLRLMI